MTFRPYFLLSVAVALLALSQNANPDAPRASVPKKPRAVLAAAAPFYNFSDPAMRPWHLKATYQLYDDKGNPTEQGTFEYWWISPKVDRGSWARPSASFTVWHTADGGHHYQVSGEKINPFEINLSSEFVFNLNELNLAKEQLSESERAWNGRELTCVTPPTSLPSFSPYLRRTVRGTTLCFDSATNALMGHYSLGVETQYNGIVKMQGHFLPQQLTMFVNGKKTIVANLTSIYDSGSADQMLIPPVPPQPQQPGQLFLLYPGDLGPPIKTSPMGQGINGSQHPGMLIIEITVDKEGKVTNAEVVSTPDRDLGNSLAKAVLRWRYHPYVYEGKAFEVRTFLEVAVLAS